MKTSARPVRGYTPRKEQLLRRLRRIEGQVRGIEKMIEEDRYCIDVLQQTAAVTAAIDRVSLQLLEDHVSHCMAEGAGDGKRREQMTAEMLAAVGRLVR
jgi:CsoR family transcriptional regulator, copper-sensing transcriptional repressor